MAQNWRVRKDVGNMSDTLILNADGQPLTVLPLSTKTWGESVKALWLDEADVIAEYENWEVHSPSIVLKVPSVLMLREYQKVKHGIRFCRENILLRDDFTCQYCGAKNLNDKDFLTLDHVVPRFHGGKTNFTNIVAACHSCNLEKAHYMKMKPNTEARRPTYWELANKIMQYPITIPHESWIDFIGWDRSLITVNQRKR